MKISNLIIALILISTLTACVTKTSKQGESDAYDIQNEYIQDSNKNVLDSLSKRSQIINSEVYLDANEKQQCNPSRFQNDFPIENVANISAFFTVSESSPFRDSDTRYDMVLRSTSTILQSVYDDSFSHSSNMDRLALNATWTSASALVYIGVINTETNVFYHIPCTGGRVAGILDLSKVPHGDYQLFVYSDNAEVLGAIVFQFFDYLV